MLGIIYSKIGKLAIVKENRKYRGYLIIDQDEKFLKVNEIPITIRKLNNNFCYKFRKIGDLVPCNKNLIFVNQENDINILADLVLK